MPPILVFDIETVPDTDGLRRLYATDDTTTPQQLAEIAFLQRRQITGTDSLQLHLQRVAAVSCILQEHGQFRVWSIGDAADSEAVILQRFFDTVDQYNPLLVSWNGNGFKLPVLHYRGLIHQVSAQRYWERNESGWESTLDRSDADQVANRHLDLMDAMSIYPILDTEDMPLDDLARLCGFPGKSGMDGRHLWEAYQTGRIADIRNYCETGAMNTYLVYLRFQKMRGALSTNQYMATCVQVRESLAGNNAPHWREFLAAWPQA